MSGYNTKYWKDGMIKKGKVAATAKCKQRRTGRLKVKFIHSWLWTTLRIFSVVCHWIFNALGFKWYWEMFTNNPNFLFRCNVNTKQSSEPKPFQKTNDKWGKVLSMFMWISRTAVTESPDVEDTWKAYTLSSHSSPSQYARSFFSCLFFHFCLFQVLLNFERKTVGDGCTTWIISEAFDALENAWRQEGVTCGD